MRYILNKELLFYVLPSLKYFLEVVDPELARGMSLGQDPSCNKPIGMFLISSMPYTFSSFCTRTIYPVFNGVPGIEASMDK